MAADTLHPDTTVGDLSELLAALIYTEALDTIKKQRPDNKGGEEDTEEADPAQGGAGGRTRSQDVGSSVKELLEMREASVARSSSVLLRHPTSAGKQVCGLQQNRTASEVSDPKFIQGVPISLVQDVCTCQ